MAIVILNPDYLFTVHSCLPAGLTIPLCLIPYALCLMPYPLCLSLFSPQCGHHNSLDGMNPVLGLIEYDGSR